MVFLVTRKIHFKKQQNTDFKRFIMINTDNSMNIFIQGYKGISFFKSCSFRVYLCTIAHSELT